MSTDINSYQGQSNIWKEIVNDHSNPSTTVDILSSLKQIEYFQDKINKKELSKEVLPIVEEELKYLRLGMTAINGSNQLQAKLGKGFQGARVASSLIKQLNTETQYKAMLEQYLPADTKNNIVGKRKAFLGLNNS